MTDVTTTEIENESTTAESTTAESTNAGIELSVNDLHSLRAIIDLASSRGAFKPSEMVAIGQAYTKLSGFLEEVAKQAELAGTK